MKDSQGLRRALLLLWRGWCLRCPRCDAQTLFRSWLVMHECCASCHLHFEREQGYFLGAMYINYALTVGIVLISYFMLVRYTPLSLGQQLVLLGSVSVLCPLLLFRRARGVWLSFDYIFNPADDVSPGQEEEWPRESL